MIQSRFKRALELSRVAAKVGFKELMSGDMPSRIEQAKILAESLTRLKGAALKAGQLLSLDLDDYFPPEAIQILSQLQNNVTEHPAVDIKKILKESLKPEVLRDLKNIESRPFAAASMGQVHRAQFLNQEIVLKVQYPGLEGAVEGDVQLLKKIFTAFCYLSGREMNLDFLFQEIEEVLTQELDYEKEAQSIAEFGDLFQNQQWQNVPVRAPTVIPELSHRQLLAMSYESGKTLKEWMEGRPSLADRERVGRSILELYIYEFFKWGLVQTDPNPGNFLVSSQPELRIVALDFGAVRRYSPEFRKGYVEILRSIRTASESEILAKVIDFGLLDPREDQEVKLLLIELLKWGFRPFESSEFDFSNDSFLKENSRLIRLLIQKSKYSAPPHQLIFLHRKLGGVFAILRKLQIQINLVEYWDQVMGK